MKINLAPKKKNERNENQRDKKHKERCEIDTHIYIEKKKNKRDSFSNLSF